MGKKKTLQQVINENEQLGFDENIIRIAYNNVDGNSDRVLDEIFRLQQQSSQFPTKPPTAQDEDVQLNKAIQESINEAKTNKISLQPLNPEQRVRKSGVPVGLKNIGNTCYFNSLLQTYFQNQRFVRTVLSYETPQTYKPKAQAQLNKKIQDDYQMKRKVASCKLVENLKIIFAKMIASDRKYIDPTSVITSIVDDYGNQLPVGDQKDIGQFNLVFLSRIDEGLNLAKSEKMMDIQMQGKPDSPSKIQILGDEHNENSLLKRSSIKLDEKSMIAKQFFGKLQNTYINEKEKIHIVEEQLFSLLFVNVKNKELYRACEQVVISHIDDYRNQKGQIVGVEKQSWIKEAPKTLFFQIDRVVFNKEKCMQEKVNTLFEFPKVFYFDPFMLRNKQKALAIQKTVRKFRAQKQKYEIGLKNLQSFGDKGINLLDLLTETGNFLKMQQHQMDIEKDNHNSAFFPNLQNSIKPEHIKLVETYKQSVEQRINEYHMKIAEIEKEIEKQYQLIRSTPYYLYSILIHEGSADSGHYYSYTYDFDSKVWKKYNDVNITEEVEEQVLKEAKGLNYTSAYYLVYAQKQVVHPENIDLPLRNWKLSKQDGYLKDYFSSFLSEELKQQMIKDNEQMYLEIQSYKMGGYVNRVIDSYTKKFETSNQIYRKSKPQKKKNTPPLLINLPLFVKFSYDDEQYKKVLIQGSIQEYGPKQPNLVFQDLLNKKLINFNDFKKPKSLNAKPEFSHYFMSNVYRAIASKKLYKAINQSQYQGIFALLQQLQSSEPGEYFSWLGNLTSKVLAVRLLLQAQQNVGQKSQKGAFSLKLLLILLFKFINIKQQGNLMFNCVHWIAEIAIGMVSPFKEQAQKITEIIANKSYNNEYQQVLSNKINEGMMEEIRGSIQIQDALWNMSRKQNTFINEMLAARQQIKNKLQVANQLYKEMKKYNYPLTQSQRDKIKFAKPHP